MNAPSVDIAAILEGSSSLGLTFNENLFVGREPSKPPNCVIIFDTPGLPPQLNLTDQGYEHPSIQIRVRNSSYETGWALISEIKEILHGIGQEIVGTVLYSAIYCAHGPFLLDWDDSSRARFVITFNLQRRLSGV